MSESIAVRPLPGGGVVRPGIGGLHGSVERAEPAPATTAAAWTGHIPALDGIRGMAIALVLVSHIVAGVRAAGPLDGWVIRAAQSGLIGVDLFLVLSGFLITGILVDARGSDGFFRTFYIRRTLRIFPLYYATLFAFFVAVPLLHPAVRSQPAYASVSSHQLWFWTYGINVFQAIAGWERTPILGHFWSLALEEQFYLIWPAVIFFCPPKRLLRVCGAIIIASLLLRTAICLVFGYQVGTYTLMPARADAFAAGAWVAVAIRSWSNLEPLKHVARSIASRAGLGLLLLFVVRGSLRYTGPAMQTVGFTCLALGGAALIVLALDAPGAPSTVGRFCRHPALRFLGKYSYAIYCFHPIVQYGLARGRVTAWSFPVVAGSVIPAVVAYGAIVSAITVAMAMLSWHLFEKHFLRLKTRFASA